MRDTIRDVVGLSYDEELEIKKLTEEAKREVRQNHIINLNKEQGDRGERRDDLREKERNMKIEMQMKIMEEVENNMKQMKREFNKEG
jgi:hypothetical protein